jgi:hypothetical protein
VNEYAEEILGGMLLEERLAQGAVRTLAAGRRLAVAPDGARLEISSPAGEVELRVEITAAGPVLRFTSIGLALSAAGALSLDCDELSLRSRGRMRLDCGDFEHVVSGGHRLAVRDDARLTAQAVAIEAETGDLDLRANDDVAVGGLRVLLNVPSDEEIAAHRAAASDLRAALAAPVACADGTSRLPRSIPRKRDGWAAR